MTNVTVCNILTESLSGTEVDLVAADNIGRSNAAATAPTYVQGSQRPP